MPGVYLKKALISSLGTAFLVVGSGVVPPAAGQEPSGDRVLEKEAEAVPEGEREVEAEGLRITGIRLKGCEQVSCRTVNSILRQEPTPWFRIKPKEGETFDSFWAEDDRQRIELFYRGKGFYSTGVDGPELKVGRGGRGVRITYRIREGEPVKVGRIEIVFVDGVHEEEDPETMRSLLELKEGRRFELEAYQESADRMKNYYQDDGFYRAEVERQALVDPEALTADVTYRITRGARFKLGSVSVTGCEKTGPEVVLKAIDLEVGGRYRRNEVLKNQRRVQRLPIYRSARLMENVDDEAQLVHLVIDVDEGKPREWRVGIGYGSEEGVRVQAGWKHVNFLGDARELHVFARYSELLEKEEIKIIEPNIRRPGDFIQLSGTRRVEHEEAYTHEAISVSPTYRFILTNYLFAEISYKLEDNRISHVLDELELKEEDLAREGLLSALSFTLDWSEVDDVLDPRRGARAMLYLELGGGPMGGDFPYTRIWGEARGYYPLFGPVVAALRWKLGWAEPMGDLDRMPLFLRYYTGGTGMVRGYDRYELGPEDQEGQPIGGIRLWEGSFELRFPIWGELGGVVFEDSGWVWPEGENYDPDDVEHGAGFGFRYMTPIGPVSLDLAVPLGHAVDSSDIRFHFNIGHTF